MPVYTVKEGRTLTFNKCPYCQKQFEENPNSQLVHVLHFKMCSLNNNQEKQKKQIKRLNDRPSKKITKYFKRK